ncbi:uncharacterized protein LOC110845635 [Folsomia candida]|uniref:Zinc finger protein 92 n=1 Tax=Folsomia candida TaxID=158441 RepID=A0A226EK92_FOLCA|nr:uncharacterized protein LOC110845635 [Folsomia candida]OXA57171.1 Zinc finger protein 92 [Folsomia candida]
MGKRIMKLSPVKGEGNAVVEGFEIVHPSQTLGIDLPAGDTAAAPSISFTCRTCHKIFPTKTKLNGHTRVHEKRSTCEDCGKEFSGPSPLKYHRWVHIGRGVRNFACEYPECGKKFKSTQDLRRHNLVHSGTRPHQCDRCDRAFNLEWVLREHKKIHDGIRPYKCNEQNCGKSFYSCKDLKRHAIIHGTETPFKCERGECLKDNRGFRRKDNFLRHLIAVHNLPKNEAKIISEEAEFTRSILRNENRMDVSQSLPSLLIKIEQDNNSVESGASSESTGCMLFELLSAKQENDFEATMASTKILTSIFKNLSIPELKSISGVCHLWRNIATKVMNANAKNPGSSKETPLFQQKLSHPEVQDKSNIVKIEKLMRRVKHATKGNSNVVAGNELVSCNFKNMACKDSISEVPMNKVLQTTRPPTLRFLTTTSPSSTPRQSVVRMTARKNSTSATISRCSASFSHVCSGGASLDVLAEVALRQGEMKPVSEQTVIQTIPTKRGRYDIESSSDLILPKTPQIMSISTADLTTTTISDQKSKSFQNAVVFIGNRRVGKSHVCNQIFQHYKSSTRFPVSCGWEQDEESHPLVATLAMEGLNYTIIDTPGFSTESLGPNLCSILKVIELCENVKTIVYVFTDSFNSSNLHLLKSLYELVGQENVLLMMNKLNKAELNQLPQIRSSICKQLQIQCVPLEQDKFFVTGLMGVLFREPDSPLDNTGCLSQFHNYLGMKGSFPLKNLKMPETCFDKESSIVRSKPYEMVVNPDLKDNIMVLRFLEVQNKKYTTTPGTMCNNNNRSDGNVTESNNNIMNSGVPHVRHFIEFATFFNEYQVRYDGNLELLGKPKEVPGSRRQIPIEIDSVTK